MVNIPWWWQSNVLLQSHIILKRVKFWQALNYRRKKKKILNTLMFCDMVKNNKVYVVYECCRIYVSIRLMNPPVKRKRILRILRNPDFFGTNLRKRFNLLTYLAAAWPRLSESARLQHPLQATSGRSWWVRVRDHIHLPDPLLWTCQLPNHKYPIISNRWMWLSVYLYSFFIEV